MRKGILIILAMITMIYYADKANAAFLLEPYVGSQIASTYDIDGGADGDLSGTVIGAKIGYTQMGFNFGLNGQRASWNLDPEVGSDSDYTFTRLGAFVGYDTMIGIRLWGEYIFSFEGVNDDDSDSKLTEGSGTSFGVGYKVIPFLSLNFEISNLATAKAETSVLEYVSDRAYTSYVLSVSLPFSI